MTSSSPHQNPSRNAHILLTSSNTAKFFTSLAACCAKQTQPIVGVVETCQFLGESHESLSPICRHSSAVRPSVDIGPTAYLTRKQETHPPFIVGICDDRSLYFVPLPDFAPLVRRLQNAQALPGVAAARFGVSLLSVLSCLVTGRQETQTAAGVRVAANRVQQKARARKSACAN